MAEPVKVRNLRELDALVAEHVLGAQWWRSDATGRRALLVPGREEKRDWFRGPADGTEPLVGDWPNYGGFDRYSESIAAAWEVVERMVERNYGKVHVSGSHYHGWHAWVTWDDDCGHGSSASDVRPVWGATAPLAISLAALRAVGVEVELAIEPDQQSQESPRS